MKRRTDRIIAISALGAVAVVPAVVLTVVNSGGDSGLEAGTMPPAAAMADRRAAGAGPGEGTVSPSAGTAPGAGAGVAGPGGSGGAGSSGGAAGPGAGSGSNGTNQSEAAKEALPDEKPKPSPELRSFVRETNVKLTFGQDGDYTRATETAQFKLWPEFALNATGVTTTMKDGELSEVTEKVVVEGDVLKGYDGQEWTQSKLTQKQLTTLQTQSDPRQFTFLMASLPGLLAEGPNEEGALHFMGEALMGDLYGLLPDDAAERVRQVVPAASGCAVDLWTNAKARPSRIGLKAQAPGAALNGSMTFGSYR